MPKRRLRIKLEIVGPMHTMVVEVGRHAAPDSTDRDPTSEEYAMASAFALLLLDVPINDIQRAMLMRIIDRYSKKAG